MAVDLNDGRRADERDWGPGWQGPDSTCQRTRWVPLDVFSLTGRLVRFPAHQIRSQAGKLVFEEDVTFPGGVRDEIRELVSLLLQVSERRGYINLEPGWCWGGACRPIKRPDGSLTTTPSNHSWGLALDINAPENPFGGATHTIDQPMAALWNAYGFRWGGDYPTSKDWMHFEFMGVPEDAKDLTEKARAGLAKEVEQLTPEQEKAIERMATFLDTLTTKLGRVDGDTGEGERERGASPKGAANRVATVVLKAERG